MRPLMPANVRSLAAAALIFNAFVWGVSWWPFRQLEALGLHPLWTTVGIYLLSSATIICVRPRAVAEVMRTPALWVLVLASGSTNAAFNWGVVVGDVVRVVLLFYLMPLWTVVLARLLLGERLTRLAAARVALALSGAAIVLWPAGGGWPLPTSMADVLGLAGGLAFALNNVMLRREAHRSEESRALAMFLGGVLVAGTLAVMLAATGRVAWPPPASAHWLWAVSGLGVMFLLSNFALQYGAARLTANAAAVVMLTEVVFAAVSSWLLAGGLLTPQLLAGGALIVLAALLSSLNRR
jgi:drug/metabolite transporter (DMT)-like permease